MNNLIRLKPPHAAAEANHGGRFYLPHIDGHVYVENEDVAGPLIKTGGYARVKYPKFPPQIWAAINALTDALDGSERQTILDASNAYFKRSSRPMASRSSSLTRRPRTLTLALLGRFHRRPRRARAADRILLNTGRRPPFSWRSTHPAMALYIRKGGALAARQHSQATQRT